MYKGSYKMFKTLNQEAIKTSSKQIFDFKYNWKKNSEFFFKKGNVKIKNS